MLPRHLIFVFGMHRTGTSAITRLLSLCGATLPDTLLVPDEANPRGYWEPLEALKLNEAFLFRNGATWYDPSLRLQNGTILKGEEREIYIDQIRVFLESCRCSGPLLLIKEPRIVTLADFWFEGARRAGFAIKVIITVRHPEEVAASLAARDGLSPELANVLWIKHNLLAERLSRGLPRVFVQYTSVLQNWRQEIGRIANALAIDLSASAPASIDAFLTDELYRCRKSLPPAEFFGQPWIGQVYAQFAEASCGLPLDLDAIDEIFYAFSACERTFRIALEEYRTKSRAELGKAKDDRQLETLVAAKERALFSSYKLRDMLLPIGSLRRRLAQRLWAAFARTASL